MKTELASLRKRVVRARSDGSSHFPKAVRAEVLAALPQWRARGGSIGAFCEAVGVNRHTLDWWRKQRAPVAKGRVVEVEVTDDESPAIVCELGRGVLIRGLSMAQVIELARGLS